MSMDPIKLPTIQTPKLGATNQIMPTLDLNSYTFQRIIQNNVKEYQAELARRKEVVSITDVFLNREAQRKSVEYYEDLLGRDFNEDSYLTRMRAASMRLTDRLSFGIPTRIVKAVQGKDMFDPSIREEIGGAMTNWLYFMGDSLDTLSYFVKSAFISGQEDISYFKALEMSFGMGSEGRHQMDFQRIADNSEFWGDGFVPVMIGELLTDPLFVWSIGKGIARGLTDAGLSRLKTAKDVIAASSFNKKTEIAQEFFRVNAFKAGADLTDDGLKALIKKMNRMDRLIKMGDKKTFTNMIIKEMGTGTIDKPTTKKFISTFDEMSKLYKSRGAAGFLDKLDEIENAFSKTILKNNPLSGPVRAIYSLIDNNPLKAQQTERLATDFISKYADLEYSQLDEFTIDELNKHISALEKKTGEVFHTSTDPDEIEKATAELNEAYYLRNKKIAAERQKALKIELETQKNLLAEAEKNLEDIKDIESFNKRQSAFNKRENTVEAIKKKVKEHEEFLKKIENRIELQQAEQDKLLDFQKVMGARSREYVELSKQYDEFNKLLEEGKITQMQYDILTKDLPSLDNAKRELETATRRFEDYEQKVKKYYNKDHETYRNRQIQKYNKDLEDLYKQEAKYQEEMDLFDKNLKESSSDLLGDELKFYTNQVKKETALAEMRLKEDEMRTLSSFFEDLKKFETLAKGSGDDLMKEDLFKYASFKAFQDLDNDVKRAAKDISKFINDVLNKAKDTETFSTAKETLQKMRDEYKALKTIRDNVIMIQKIIELSGANENIAKVLANFLNKSGNTNLYRIVKNYAESYVKDYENFLKKQSAYVKGILDRINADDVSMFDLNDLNNAKNVIGEFKTKYNEARRLRNLIKDDMFEKMDIELEQTYRAIFETANKNMVDNTAKIKAEFDEIMNIFDSSFDMDFDYTLNYYNRKVSDLRIHIKELELQGDQADEILLAQQRATLDEFMNKVEELKEAQKTSTKVSIKDFLKQLQAAIKEQRYHSKKGTTIPTPLARAHKDLTYRYTKFYKRFFDNKSNLFLVEKFKAFRDETISRIDNIQTQYLGDNDKIIHDVFTETANFLNRYINLTVFKVNMADPNEFPLAATLNDVLDDLIIARKNPKGSKQYIAAMHRITVNTLIDDTYTLLFEYLKTIQTSLLEEAHMVNPRNLLTYLSEINSKNPMAEQLLGQRHNVYILERSLKESSTIRLDKELGRAVPLPGAPITEFDEILMNAYNSNKDLLDILSKKDLDILDIKEIQKSIKTFEEVRLHEHLLSLDLYKDEYTQVPLSMVKQALGNLEITPLSDLDGNTLTAIRRLLEGYAHKKMRTYIDDYIQLTDKVDELLHRVDIGEANITDDVVQKYLNDFSKFYNLESEELMKYQLDEMTKELSVLEKELVPLQNELDALKVSPDAMNKPDKWYKLDMEVRSRKMDIATLKRQVDLKKVDIDSNKRTYELMNKINKAIVDKASGERMSDLLSKLFRSSNYGAIFSSMRELFTIKHFRIDGINHMVDNFYDVFVEPLLRNNKRPQLYYSELAKKAMDTYPEFKKRFASQLKSEASKRRFKKGSSNYNKLQRKLERQLSDAYLRKEAVKMFSQSQNMEYIKGIPTQFNAMRFETSTLSKLRHNEELFNKTPFDNLNENFFDTPEIFRTISGKKVKTGIEIHPHPNSTDIFTKDGKPINPGVVDIETIPKLNDDGTITELPFQVAIKHDDRTYVYYLQGEDGAYKLPQELQDLTGITQEVYENSGHKHFTLEEFQNEFKINHSNIEMFMAHNSKFDFFESELFTEDMLGDTPILDTLPFFQILFDDTEARFGLEALVNNKLGETHIADTVSRMIERGDFAEDIKNLAEADPFLKAISNHNAQVDVELTADLLKGNTTEILEKLNKYGIKTLDDLNNPNKVLMTNEIFKLKNKRTLRIKPLIELDTSALNSNELAYFESYSKLQSVLKGVEMSYKTSDSRVLLHQLTDAEEYLDDLKKIYDRAYVDERQMYMGDITQIPDEVLAQVEQMEDIVNVYRRNLNVVIQRRKSIYDAVYGNATATLMYSKFKSFLMIADPYDKFKHIPQLLEIFNNKLVLNPSANNREMSRMINFYMEELLNDNFPETIGKIEPGKVNALFKEKFTDHPLVQLQNKLQDVDDYMKEMNEIFGMFSLGVMDEANKRAIHSFSDLMFGLDKELQKELKAYTRALELGNKNPQLPDLNRLKLRYYEIATETGANKYIKDMTQIETSARANVKMDVLTRYWDMVEKRFNRALDKLQNQDALNRFDTHVLLNPDTLLTNDLYHNIKAFFLDVANKMDKTYKHTENGTVEEIGVFAEYVQGFLNEMLEGFRGPLRDIKYYNREQEMLPRHLGFLNKYWKEGIESGKYSDMLRDADIKNTSALTVLGSEKALKLSEETKKAYKTKKAFYSLFNGITDEAKRLSSDNANFKKMADLAHNELYKVFDDLIQSMDYPGDVLDFLKYAERNVNKTTQRAYKVEVIENYIALASNVENVDLKLFPDIQRVLRSLDEWASNPGKSYLSGEDMSLDPARVDEFMSRVKATMYDYIEDTNSLKLTQEYSKLYSKGKILDDVTGKLRDIRVSDIKHTQAATLRYAQDHFKNSYRNIRALLFDNTDAGREQFVTFLKDNDLSLVVQVEGKNGFEVRRLVNPTNEMVKQLDDTLIKNSGGFVDLPAGAFDESWGNLGIQNKLIPFGVMDSHSYQTLRKVMKNIFKFHPDSVQSILRRFLLAPLKVVSLFSANFTLGNAVDITLKNIKASEGGMLNSFTLIGNTWRAMKLHHKYIQLYDEAHKVLNYSVFGDSLEHNWVELYKNYLASQGDIPEEILRELELAEFVRKFLGTEAAASEANQMMMRMRLNKIGAAKHSTFYEKMNNKIFFGKLGPEGSALNFNPLSMNLQLNGWLETVGRMGLHLDDISKGLTGEESLNKILKTHFNYSNKSQAEMYAEFIIPFISYPLRSFAYWSDALFDDAVELRGMIKALEVAWGDELDDNDYAQYQMSRGNIPVGDHVLQTGFTFMDAIQMGTLSANRTIGDSNVPLPIPDQAIRKMNPAIKSLALRATGEYDTETAVQRFPIINQYTRLANIPNAFQSGDVDELFPSVLDPYNRGSWNQVRRLSQYRNANFMKPINANTISFRMFGNLSYNASEKVSYRMMNVNKYYRL